MTRFWAATARFAKRNNLPALYELAGYMYVRRYRR